MTKWKAAKVQWHDADSDPTAFNDIIERLKSNNLYEIHVRLMKEAELALEIAHSLNAAFPLRDINVHLDINPDKRFASSKVLTNAVSWVNSYGYNVFIKPNAWASSSLADAFAK